MPRTEKRGGGTAIAGRLAALGLAVAVGMLTACAALGGAPVRFLLSLRI